MDWLYCNAGIMPVTGINWGAFWPPTFSNIKQLFSTGGDLLQIIDDTTQEGLKQIFGTNVFGHFLMVSTTSLVNRISLIPRSSVGGSLYPIPPPPLPLLPLLFFTHTQIQHLEDFLSSQGRPCHIIWTSSGAADRVHFDSTDIQGKRRW